jgi:WD40 repeat protein
MSLLLSGSTDASLRVWSCESQSKEPTLLHTLKGHSRSIEDIAIDYSALSKDNVVVFTASSDRTIRKWNISRDRAAEDGEPLIIHETSVYSLKVYQEDMWTCTLRLRLELILGSADKTAQRYDRISGSQEVFQHPDLVRDIVASGGFVYTACGDENVRQWSLDVCRCTGIVNHRP